jgi:hypothetical protein
MHFTNRWILSQTIGTVTLLILVVIFSIPRHFWLDLLHMWFVVMGINNLRLTFSRDRRVA